MINSIKEILSSEDFLSKEILIAGWVKTFRANRFIALNDGSTINNLQCVIDFEKYNDEFLKKISTGSALEIKGKVIESQGSKQSIEVLFNHSRSSKVFACMALHNLKCANYLRVHFISEIWTLKLK